MSKQVVVDPLVKAVESAQRVVDSLARYIRAAQAVEDYIVSQIAGPCSRSNQMRQTDEICVAYSSACLRDAPIVVGDCAESLLNAQVFVYAKTDVLEDGRVWYYVQVNDGPLAGRRGWIGVQPEFQPCDHLPTVSTDFDPSIAVEPGFVATDCSGPGNGCIEVREEVVIFGGLKIRTHPSGPYLINDEVVGQQVTGREIGRLQSGVFFYDAVQPDIDGCWYHLIAENGEGGWVKNSAGGFQNLSTTDCAEARVLTENDFSLGELPDFGTALCAEEEQKEYRYPLEGTPEEKIAFILECESGGDPTSSVAIANIILNRMMGVGRSAVEIVQNGEWTCLCGRDTPVNPSALVQELARQLAALGDASNPANIVALDTAALPVSPRDLVYVPPEIGRALYTVGIRLPEGINQDNVYDNGSVHSLLGEVCYSYINNPNAFDRTGCRELYGEFGSEQEIETAISNLRAIYIGVTLRPGGEFATLYFTNLPLIAICKSF